MGREDLEGTGGEEKHDQNNCIKNLIKNLLSTMQEEEERNLQSNKKERDTIGWDNIPCTHRYYGYYHYVRSYLKSVKVAWPSEFGLQLYFRQKQCQYQKIALSYVHVASTCPHERWISLTVSEKQPSQEPELHPDSLAHMSHLGMAPGEFLSLRAFPSPTTRKT